MERVNPMDTVKPTKVYDVQRIPAEESRLKKYNYITGQEVNWVLDKELLDSIFNKASATNLTHELQVNISERE